MYRPRMGLAYCVFLHSSLWVVVCGRSVCDLVMACVRCSCLFLFGVCPALVVLRVVLNYVYIIKILLSVSNDKDLMMTTTGRNMLSFDLEYNI